MNEFRIAKCLVNGKVNDYAIFADSSRKKILQKDDKGNCYFNIDNPFRKDDKLSSRSFTGRIKDAVDAVRQGYGDVIGMFNLFGQHINVRYYLDRTIGEEYRKKTIDGWKDTRFSYIIKLGNPNSMSGLSVIQKDYQVGFMRNDNILYFDTAEDAENWWNNIITKCQDYTKILISFINDDTEDKSWDKLMDIIHKDYHTDKYIVLFDIIDKMYHIIDGKAYLVTDLDEVYQGITHRIEQTVIEK